jgi:hypothetical protein
MADKAAKSGPGHGDGGSDRAKALATYASREAREKGYSKADFDYIGAHWDTQLASTFAYDRR